MNIIIVNYSEKSFVLIGDTKKYKEQIKNIGGKWNPKLKGSLKGWVFSKKNLNKVQEFLKENSINYNFIENERENVPENKIEKENKFIENKIKKDIKITNKSSCVSTFFKNLFYFFIIIFFIYSIDTEIESIKEN